MMGILNNKKGAAIIISLLVVVVLMILSSIFLSMSIGEKNLAQREKDTTAAFYLATRGIEYAYREMIHGPWSGWHTHSAVLDDTSDYALRPILDGQGQSSLPIYLNDKCVIDINSASPTYGCYVPLFSTTSAAPLDNFAVKTYADPLRQLTHTIILSKGTSGSITQTLAKIVNTQSLYQYFIFSPRGLGMNQTTYNAGGGMIHANADTTWFENVIIQDISEFSTYGAFQYGYVPYVPPDTWGTPPGGDWDSYFELMRFPWTTPLGGPWPNFTIDPNDPYGDQWIYYNNPDGHQYGNFWGAQAGPYVVNNINPSIWTTIQVDPQSGTVPVQIPNYYPSLSLAQYYGINLYMEVPAQYAGPTPDPLQINLLNSVNQHSDWLNFTQTNGLDEVLQDLLTGAQYIEPLTINPTTYRLSAEEGGMYIKKNTDANIGTIGELMVKLNGQWYGGLNNPAVPAFIQEEDFYNTNSGNQYVYTSPEDDDRVVQIDVSQMTNNPQWQPGNGIVYSTKHLLIINGSVLPQQLEGITWVTQGHGMIQGDYNNDDDTYRPSALITAGLPYVLSNQFDLDYYDENVMSTFYHLDYPYESGPYGYQQNYTQGTDTIWGYNWYAEHWNEMPIQVTEDIDVNLSIIGSNALNIQQLELWGYWDDPGTSGYNNTPPSVWLPFNRYMQGAFITLPPGNFQPNFNYEVNPPVPYGAGDPNMEDIDDQSQNRSDLNGQRDPRFPGWPYNMTSVRPDQEHFEYETRYFPENGPSQLPPGMLLGFTQELWIPVYNDFYFNHHNPAFSYIVPQSSSPPPPEGPPPVYTPPFMGQVLD